VVLRGSTVAEVRHLPGVAAAAHLLAVEEPVA